MVVSSLLGCELDRPASGPDIEATVQARVEATVVAGLQGTLSPGRTPPSESPSIRIVPTRERGVSSIPASSAPKPSQESLIIVNDPAELNLTIQDFPEGWDKHSEGYTRWNEHHTYFSGPVVGLSVDVIQSQLKVLPTVADAENEYAQEYERIAKTHSVGNPEIGDESFRHQIGWPTVFFRVRNVVAQVFKQHGSYGGSSSDATEWAKTLESKINRIKRMGTALVWATPTPLPVVTPTAFQEQGHLEKAIGQYDQAIRLNPQDAEAYINRGNAYAALGQLERAIQDFDEAIRLNPQYAEAYNNRGNAYDDLGQPQRAIKDYDEAIRLNPEYAKAYYNRGNAYGSLDQPERAIIDYDKAIRLDSQLAPSYNNRGLAYAALGQFERAIQDYDEAIRLNPQHTNAYYNRGLTYETQGKKAEAISDFEKFITLTENPQLIESARQEIEQLSK